MCISNELRDLYSLQSLLDGKRIISPNKLRGPYRYRTCLHNFVKGNSIVPLDKLRDSP
jgi:hypothetical protein